MYIQPSLSPFGNRIKLPDCTSESFPHGSKRQSFVEFSVGAKSFPVEFFPVAQWGRLYGSPFCYHIGRNGRGIGQGIFMFIVYIRIYIYTERSGVIADFTDLRDSLVPMSGYATPQVSYRRASLLATSRPRTFTKVAL